MSNIPSLQESVSPAETGEAVPQQEDMDQEALSSPTQEAQLGLQNMGIGEREKHAKEIETCTQLLDQVRGFLGLDTDRVTRSKSKVPPTHKDLDDALLCSSVTAYKHAEAFGNVALQQANTIQNEQVAPNTEAVRALKEEVKQLKDELELLKPRVEANKTSIKTNTDAIKANKDDIATVKTALQAIEERITANDTNIQLDQEQYTRLCSEIWQSLSAKVLELSIEDHKRKLVIYGLEHMGYNVQANNRQIYKSIINDANFRDQLP